MKIKHRWQKIAIGITGGILVILILLTIGGFFFLKPLVTSRIRKGVEKASNHLYSISFSDITYNPSMGQVFISDVKFTPDTLVYRRLHALKKAPNDLLTISVPAIRLTGVFPLSVIFSKTLNLSNIVVQKPAITLRHNNFDYNADKQSAERKTPYQFISKYLTSLSINKVSLNDVNLTYENYETKTPKKSVVEHLNIDIADVLIDSLAHKSGERIYYAHDYTFTLKETTLPDKNQLADNLLKDVVFSLKKRTLTVKEYHLKPRFDEMSFAKASGGRDRTEVQFKNIIMKDIHPDKLFPEIKLYANNLSLDSGYVKVFNDKRYPRKVRNKVGEYPHQLLKKLGLKINIDTVSISNVKVTYSEYDPEAKLTGFISFDHIKGRVLHATNDSLPLLKNPVCYADFHTYFMNKGSLDVHFIFNTTSEKGDFICKGQLGYFEGTSINNITIALTKVGVESLQVNKYVFNMKGNDNYVTGTGILYYENLKANILKVDKTPDEEAPKRRFRLFKKRPVPTFLVNNLVLKDSNPSKKNKLRTGTIKYTRVPTKSFFGTLWGGLSQSLFQCVTGTVKD
ncbi:hypothetical protein [Emticicia sp. 17c]|uniref:hypothetical protein n=1 Tax=Emticicia sp. 17c TaxID=3127704 RepID=UPI00301C57E5